MNAPKGRVFTPGEFIPKFGAPPKPTPVELSARILASFKVERP